mmetsp:Transcript_34774/g.54336  ORF Transcript_34774/g.54336 Transcript_34774/m.54336 type:complete len:80 (+) Transcript_34774:175-414(+)
MAVDTQQIFEAPVLLSKLPCTGEWPSIYFTPIDDRSATHMYHRIQGKCAGEIVELQLISCQYIVVPTVSWCRTCNVLSR